MEPKFRQKTKATKGKSTTKRKQSKRWTKPRGGGKVEVEVEVGPMDTTNHTYLENDDIAAHIQEMDRKKSHFSKKYKIFKDEYDKEFAEKAKDKERDYLKKQGLLKEQNALERVNDQMEQKISQQTTAMLGNVLGAAGTGAGKTAVTGANLVKNVLVGVFSSVLAVGKGTAYGINVLGFVSSFLVNTVGNVVGSIMKNVLAAFFKFFFQLVFAILFFVLIILLIVYGASIFTKKSSPNQSSGGGSQSDPGCSSILTDSLNVNISGLTDMFNKDKINQAVNNVKEQILKHKPTFDMMPDYDFTFTNFIKNPMEFGGSFYKTCVNHPAVKNVTSTIATTQESVNSIVGNTNVVKTDRATLSGGRCDNTIMIDTAMIRDKSILPLSMQNAEGAVLNIAVPKNVEWLLPGPSYNNRDIKQLPDSVLKNKGIKEKESITIPWINSGNEYKLSCSDAFFTNYRDQKAEVLIDNVDSHTCSFNISTPVTKFTSAKKRCEEGVNLDVFLP
jgi:hypothetical protein